MKIRTFLTTALALSFTAAASAQSYTITDLGALPGGNYSFANAINDAGAVVGNALVKNGSQHAFLWTASGGISDLGILPGGSSSYAYGINHSNEVVGASFTSTNGPVHFLWTPAGGMVTLETLGGNSGVAFGVNNNGDIVGYATTAAGNAHAALWPASGGIVDLGTLDGTLNSEVFAISQSGIMVGTSNVFNDPNQWHAALWTSTGGTLDLGVLAAGTFSDGTAINASGQIVGVSTTSSGNIQEAIFWTPGSGMKPLGTGPNSGAVGVNSSGEVVGFTGNHYNETAFLWTLKNHYQALNDLIGVNSGWDMKIAIAINDSGQIATSGILNGTMSHAALLTPIN